MDTNRLESFSKVLTALAWPLIFAVMVLKFAAPLAKLIESALGRRFTIKVAGIAVCGRAP